MLDRYKNEKDLVVVFNVDTKTTTIKQNKILTRPPIKTINSVVILYPLVVSMWYHIVPHNMDISHNPFSQQLPTAHFPLFANTL